MTKMTNYGVITEQGDLGLGFNTVTESEEKSIRESQQQEEDEKKETANK